MKRLKIAFLWDGITGERGEYWGDGLQRALRHLADRHIVQGFEPDDTDNIVDYHPDALLHWGALEERLKKDVMKLPYPKALCFAGGPIEPQNTNGYDLYFIENEIVRPDFDNLGVPTKLAFGVNDDVFRPMKEGKKYLAAFAGAFALWKRHDLFAASVGERGISIGQKQEHEKECYEVCEKNGVEVRGMQHPEEVARVINQSEFVLNPASFWGGGQRLTLEAMACNVRPIVMEDSPKNREYVEESGFGYVVEPSAQQIKDLLEHPPVQKTNGREYIESKWTARHYANSLEDGLLSIL